MGCKAVSAREIVELHNEFASPDLPANYGMGRLTVPRLPNETSRPGPQKKMIFYFMAPCQNVIFLIYLTHEDRMRIGLTDRYKGAKKPNNHQIVSMIVVVG